VIAAIRAASTERTIIAHPPWNDMLASPFLPLIALTSALRFGIGADVMLLTSIVNRAIIELKQVARNTSTCADAGWPMSGIPPIAPPKRTSR
jgi:hypothetical protein